MAAPPPPPPFVGFSKPGPYNTNPVDPFANRFKKEVAKIDVDSLQSHISSLFYFIFTYA